MTKTEILRIKTSAIAKTLILLSIALYCYVDPTYSIVYNTAWFVSWATMLLVFLLGIISLSNIASEQKDPELLEKQLDSLRPLSGEKADAILTLFAIIFYVLFTLILASAGKTILATLSFLSFLSYDIHITRLRKILKERQDQEEDT